MAREMSGLIYGPDRPPAPPGPPDKTPLIIYCGCGGGSFRCDRLYRSARPLGGALQSGRLGKKFQSKQDEERRKLASSLTTDGSEGDQDSTSRLPLLPPELS